MTVNEEFGVFGLLAGYKNFVFLAIFDIFKD